MEKKNARRETVPALLEQAHGLRPGLADEVSRSTGIPAADVHGVASFYTLFEPKDRVCQGLSCRIARGKPPVGQPASCLGQCDRAPAGLSAALEVVSAVQRGRVMPDDPELPINLGGEDDAAYASLAKARVLGASAVLDEIEASGLQGRGGAGFPAHFKWKAVREQPEAVHYVVVNADEAEPGTFKDREIMLRRPHRLIEGLAIAAEVVGAREVYLYLRGEFQECRRSLDRALDAARSQLGDLEVHFVMGHGAYICGEETALLESIEGKRGQPRLRPPYPTTQGLWGKPTLINNVETLACVPDIVLRGGQRFRGLGRNEPGSKLYCISGHVVCPGVYELPLGVCLDELVDAAGGYLGTPRAFSPGGASSGFLPMSYRKAPLDFGSLREVGCGLGSAGVVVLDDGVNLADAARCQAVFFEDESCGKCAPCRIGTRVQRRAVDRFLATRDPSALQHVEDVHWEMEEGSICGLGHVASLPLVSALRHFPEDFQ